MRTSDREPADASPSWESFVSAILRAHAAELAAKRRHPDALTAEQAHARELEPVALHSALSPISSRPTVVP